MSDRPFPTLPGGYPFPDLELEILRFWDENRIFAASLAQTEGGPDFLFYEGPPTANNKPHIGHVVTRAVKDLFPRFKTMQGFHVMRKAGWDTHGLPVEIEVEKALGFSGKKDIESYGVEKFNRACLESVDKYERQWREMTERIGFWMDLEQAYFTYTNDYIESVWWALATLFDKGLLEKGYKIQPYCTRCGTTLSSHEVAQNYQDADDPSVWVLFPVRPGQDLETTDKDKWTVPDNLNLVAWTTTPWTLLGHTGLAVHTDLVYRVVEDPGPENRLLLFGDDLETSVPREVDLDGKRKRIDLRELPVVKRLSGAALYGLRYDRPFATSTGEDPPKSVFDPPPGDREGWGVFTADYVTATEGTGLVHTAPAFGEDDHESGKKLGLPLLLTVDGEGRIRGEGTAPFTGLSFKEADPPITRDLRQRALLLHSDRYHHNYPFCWRCDQPLLYYASRSWFIKTTRRKDALIRHNREDISWRPEHVGEGRFGKWLENVVDWALSRKRYWGTPLPVWECDRCPRVEVIGSFAELFRAAGRTAPADLYDREQFDPHRPFVDRDHDNEPFVWTCSACNKGTMGRVTDVIDAWFDSGAMPFAQNHYTGTGSDRFDPENEIGFPAHFISEAVDQTRGWFYTLHVLGVLLFDQAAYRNCIVLGHINDEQGRKMSKRLGNVVDPMEVLTKTGADALRWYFYISNPELSERFSTRLVREAAQKFLLPLWNAASFFTIYANIDGWQPGGKSVEFSSRPTLDRWILIRLDRVVGQVTAYLEEYRIADAARELERFLDDLTNWYIRRSRDRFWAAVGDAGKESAYQTLYEALTTLSKLIAPFTPFVAEVLHQRLVRAVSDAVSGETPADSVHLESWPEGDTSRRDAALEAGIAAVQRIVRLGHAARNEHNLKTRQPLAAVTIVSTDKDLETAVGPSLDLLREELNVREVLWAEDRSQFVHHEVRPVFPKCGPRFGKQMKTLQQILAAADGDVLAADLESDGEIRIELEGEPVRLTADELEVRLVERAGTATQGDRDLLVALETELDDELISEGRAREVVHRIQAIRKDLDLDYADRIRIFYRADPAVEAVIELHRHWIGGETLAVEIESASGDRPLESRPLEELELRLAIERVDV
ncbi:MAG: isoleucine--tRNA ligase [Acidobacteriota bacterium]|nr:isoleucine--tRNA ligase [Acidobacteriota bacterium]